MKGDHQRSPSAHGAIPVISLHYTGSDGTDGTDETPILQINSDQIKTPPVVVRRCQRNGNIRVAGPKLSTAI